jgi:hypothetical protein
MRTHKDDEIEIKATGGSLQDVHIYITNIRPESNIQRSDDPEFIGKLVSQCYCRNTEIFLRISLKFVSDFRQVGGFLQVLQFPS